MFLGLSWQESKILITTILVCWTLMLSLAISTLLTISYIEKKKSTNLNQDWKGLRKGENPGQFLF